MSSATKQGKQGRQGTKNQDRAAALQASIDRVTRFLRPAEDVSKGRFLGALYVEFSAQPDDDARAALMTHVLTTVGGPSPSAEHTPLAAYPALPKGLTDEYIANEMHKASDGVHDGFDMAVEQAFGNGQARDAKAIGRFAAGYIASFEDPRAQAHAFLHTLSLENLIEYPMPTLEYDGDTVSEEEYAAVIGKHRDTAVTAARAFERAETNTGAAEALLKVTASIGDPRERTMVIGQVIGRVINVRAKQLAEQLMMMAQLKQQLGAIFGGGPGGDGQPDDNGPGLLLPPGARGPR